MKPFWLSRRSQPASQLFSLWRHAHDVIRAAGAYGARNPRASYSHYDVILIVTSFATELATPGVTDERTSRTDTSPRLIYKDSA